MGYAVNSGIRTKSCIYDFSKDGGITGVPKYAGISFKPGEAIVDVRATILTPLNSTVGLGATLSLTWFIYTLYKDTLAVFNGKLSALFSGVTANTGFQDTQHLRLPFTATTSLPVNFYTLDTITAGKVAFVITYQFTRF